MNWKSGRYEECVDVGRVKVRGYVCGAWGIRSHFPRCAYVVTHIPTGYAVDWAPDESFFDKLAAAKLWAEMLEEAGFASITVEACARLAERERMRALRKRFQAELLERGLA